MYKSDDNLLFLNPLDAEPQFHNAVHTSVADT